MAAVVALLIVVLSVLTTAGSSDVFRVVNGSVQLDINGSVSEFDDFTWTFSGSVPVLKYYKKLNHITHSPRYKDRVEFNEETCSLILKNLQKNDSGLYEVKASNTEKITTATYRLSVLDPVEPPALTVQNSTEPCNSTLTCTCQVLSINSSCNKETCEEKEVTSPGGVTLSLSVRKSTIICNHSNPVSWKKDDAEMKALGHLCAHTGTEPLKGHSGSYWPGILIAVGVLGILVVVYRWIKQRRSGDFKGVVNTIYEGVENNDQPTPPEVTVYSTVEIKKPVPASVTVESSKPETTYSRVKNSS